MARKQFRGVIKLDVRDSKPDVVWVARGHLPYGMDQHYPEEAPAHRVTDDGFWIDCAPVTNRQFRDFVDATGHLTVAEIAPGLRSGAPCRPRPHRPQRHGK